MNYTLKILLRNFVRRPVYSFITFTGFVIGIVSALLIYLWVVNELSYEKFHPDYNRIYRVLTLSWEGDAIVKSAGCYRPLARSLKMTYPQIERATYLSYSSEDSPLQKATGGDKIETRRVRTNEDFFAIFGGFIFLEGSPEEAFNDPSKIVLSETTARKLFGSEAALGQTLISEKYDKELFTVGGVVRIPAQSHIDFGFIQPESSGRYAHLQESWGDKSHVRVYIKFAENAHIDKKFVKEITSHLQRIRSKRENLAFQSIADIHLHTDYETYLYDLHISSYRYVWIFSGLALLIIIMVALNFSVLSLALSSERSKEIGMRKIAGAGRVLIIRQFLVETVFQTITATGIALGVVWIILPWFNILTGQTISLHLSVALILTLLVFSIVVGIVAGLYPALSLAGQQPVQSFRGYGTTGSRAAFIKWLVVTQFAIAIFFMIATFVFIKQLNYIQNKDMGFDRKDIVVIPTGLWYGNKSFKEELLRNPDIISVSATTYPPVDFGWQMRFDVKHGERIDSIGASMIWVDEDFAKTYRLEILQGKFFDMDFSGYWKALEQADSLRMVTGKYGLSLPAVINEAAAEIMGFENPVGQHIGNFIIVGVVKDFHFRPLHYPIGPLIMTNDPQNIMTMNVRVAPGKYQEALKYISSTYKKHRDSRSFSYNFFDDLLAQKYQEESRLKNLTVAFTLLAMIISILGILGLAVFVCDRRTQEVGIRKANGARVIDILIMLNKDFLLWVVAAVVIASPVAWYTMNKWLENFAYRTTLSWWLFILAGFLALVLAFIVVAWQTTLVARKNPVESLRYE